MGFAERLQDRTDDVGGFRAVAGEEYRKRAWCQVELLMAYAYMNTGAVVFGLTKGFKHKEQPASHVEDLVVTDPREGDITNR